MNGTPATDPPPRATESESARVDERLNARQQAPRSKRTRTVDVEAPSFLAALMNDIRWFFRFLRDPNARMPGETKVILIIALAYVLMPFDFLPDVIPGIGVLDDAFVIGMVVSGIRSMLDAYRRARSSAGE